MVRTIKQTDIQIEKVIQNFAITPYGKTALCFAVARIKKRNGQLSPSCYPVMIQDGHVIVLTPGMLDTIGRKIEETNRISILGN